MSSERASSVGRRSGVLRATLRPAPTLGVLRGVLRSPRAEVEAGKCGEDGRERSDDVLPDIAGVGCRRECGSSQAEADERDNEECDEAACEAPNLGGFGCRSEQLGVEFRVLELSTLASTTVAVFRCVIVLLLSVMRGGVVWLPCVTSFPGWGWLPGPGRGCEPGAVVVPAGGALVASSPS